MLLAHGIGLNRLELAIQQIGRNGQVVLAVGGHHIPALAPGLDAVLFHELLNTVFANPHTPCQQFFPDSGPTVFTFTTGVRCLDMRQHSFVAQSPTLP